MFTKQEYIEVKMLIAKYPSSVRHFLNPYIESNLRF
jgi:hypothetical protein